MNSEIAAPPAHAAAAPKLSIVDLFAGAGGLSEGFRLAGYSVLGGLDVDPDAVATYRHNFGSAEAICGNIRQPAIRERVSALANDADVIIGGPPCQAFSQVRNHTRLIEDPRNSLYREFVRVVREARPLAFVMENVTGMDQMGVREQIAEDLAIEGDYIVQPQVLDAADFGVPQTRKRLLFIGVHRSLRVRPPVLAGSDATFAITLDRTPTKRERYKVSIADGLWSEEIAARLRDPQDTTIVSVEKAISDLACLTTGNREDQLPYKELASPASAYQRLMRAGAGAKISNVQVPRINPDTKLRLTSVPQGGNHRDLPDALLDRYLTGQRWGQDNGTGKLSRRHFYAYRRLHPGIWAWTLNTKADSVYHYSVSRALSVREFARIQSFSDSFVFTCDPRKGPLPGRIDGGPAHSRYRQVGNAVPPLLAKAAGEALRELLATRVAFRRRTA